MARWADDSEVSLNDDGRGPFTLPARYYTDPDVFEAERDLVFSTTWQLVGDVERVADPGEYVTGEIAGTGVIVVRDADGELHAFHNVCAHRGSRLLDDGAGSRRMLQCPYHGWTYELDGTFNVAPNFEEEALDPEANSLRELSVETFGPLVFVTLDPDPDPLEELLAPVAADFAPFRIDEFRRVRTVEYVLDCNWKVYVDNYLECDHCHLNHPSFVDSLDMDGYEIAAGENHVAQYGTIERDSGMDSAEDDRVDEAARGRYVSAWLWPNVTVDVTPRSFETASVEPVDHERTTLVVDYYNRSGEETGAWEEAFEFSRQVMAEDVELCERQQAGLSSGVFRQGRLGPTEHGVHRFQSLVAERLDR